MDADNELREIRRWSIWGGGCCLVAGILAACGILAFVAGLAWVINWGLSL